MLHVDTNNNTTNVLKKSLASKTSLARNLFSFFSHHSKSRSLKKKLFYIYTIFNFEKISLSFYTRRPLRIRCFLTLKLIILVSLKKVQDLPFFCDKNIVYQIQVKRVPLWIPHVQCSMKITWNFNASPFMWKSKIKFIS